MTRTFGSVGLLAALLSVSVAMLAQNRTGSSALPSLANGDWPHYTADIRGTKDVGEIELRDLSLRAGGCSTRQQNRGHACGAR